MGRLIWAKAAGLAGVLALSACGGGGGSAGVNPGTPAPLVPLAIDPSDASDSTIPSGSLQQRALVLRNTNKVDARNLRVRVALDANVLQLPLSCDASASTTCQLGADGALEISALPAGASLTLRQQLRVKPGFSGTVSNDWTVSSADASLAGHWQQALKARVVDVGLVLQSTTVSGTGASRVIGYDILLSNAGPDEARDVVWTQSPGIDMPWLGATCSADGGAVCPATLGGSIKLASVPRGGSLRLVLNYGGRSGATVAESEFLASQVRTAGDSRPGNDRLLVRQANPPGHSGTDGLYDLIDLEGHAASMTLNFQPGSGRQLRIKGEGLDLVNGVAVDNTGFVSIRPSFDPSTPWYGDGTLQMSTSLLVGSLNLGHGFKIFLAARDWVTDLAELEGTAFTLLGSRVDTSGSIVDSYARTARFIGGALQLCESSTPVSLDACPAAQLRRYEAALVGSEIELMSSTEVLRLRAVRLGSKPVLLRSERALNGDGATFWIGVPVTQAAWFNPSYIEGMPPATFASASGLATPTSFGRISADYQDPANILIPEQGLPNSALRAVQEHGFADMCRPLGALQPTSIMGLYQGSLTVSCGAVGDSYQGPIYFAQTNELAVLLGRKDGALNGRWLITTE